MIFALRDGKALFSQMRLYDLFPNDTNIQKERKQVTTKNIYKDKSNIQNENNALMA